MKNTFFILALLLSTTFVLSAQQNLEPLASNKSGSTNKEYYGNNGQRGNDYNHRYGNNGGRVDDHRDNRYYGNNGRHGGGNGRHGGGYGHGHGGGHGHHAGQGHGHGGGHGHHAGHGHGHGGHGHAVSRRHGHRYVGYCNYTNHNYGWAPVSVSIFNGCCQRIRRCGFESDRLREAMYFVDHHYVSSHQIADMMHFLEFESSRLEFAKYAFHKTCDIQNYGVVFGELQFRSSRQELDCYIRDYTW